MASRAKKISEYAIGVLSAGNTYFLGNVAGVTKRIAALASNITFTPAGSISATTVQGALEELDSEKVSKSGGTMTDNLAFANGKGIDFSATPGTDTSELLNDYEEGAWTPIDSSGAGLAFSGALGIYTKIGRQVTVNGQLTFPATASVADIAIGGLPFAVGTFSVGTVTNPDVLFTITSNTVFYIYDVAGTRKTNVNYSGVAIYFTIVYFV